MQAEIWASTFWTEPSSWPSKRPAAATYSMLSLTWSGLGFGFGFGFGLGLGLTLPLTLARPHQVRVHETKVGLAVHCTMSTLSPVRA